jgi:HSP20 family protein
MAHYTRFDPFRDMLSLQDSLVHAFDAAYGRNQPGPGKETAAVNGSWTPAVDVFEDQDALHLLVELPGVPMKEIDLRVEGNSLSLRGERKLERDEARQGYHLVERVYGAFQRSFTLPPTVDAEHVTAEARDGVLTVRLPKKAESKPRQIKVQVDAARLERGPTDKQ